MASDRRATTARMRDIELSVWLKASSSHARNLTDANYQRCTSIPRHVACSAFTIGQNDRDGHPMRSPEYKPTMYMGERQDRHYDVLSSPWLDDHAQERVPHPNVLQQIYVCSASVHMELGYSGVEQLDNRPKPSITPERDHYTISQASTTKPW